MKRKFKEEQNDIEGIILNNGQVNMFENIENDMLVEVQNEIGITCTELYDKLNEFAESDGMTRFQNAKNSLNEILKNEIVSAEDKKNCYVEFVKEVQLKENEGHLQKLCCGSCGYLGF